MLFEKREVEVPQPTPSALEGAGAAMQGLQPPLFGPTGNAGMHLHHQHPAGLAGSGLERSAHGASSQHAAATEAMEVTAPEEKLPQHVPPVRLLPHAYQSLDAGRQNSMPGHRSRRKASAPKRWVMWPMSMQCILCKHESLCRRGSLHYWQGITR